MAGLNQVFEFLAALKNIPWGKIPSAELQKLIDDPRRLAVEFPKFIRDFGKGDLVEEAVSEALLRLVSTDEVITIAPCDGSRYIVEEKQVFKSSIEDLFASLGLDKRGKSTTATSVSVYEMVKDATFTQTFNSLGSDLDKLCLTQHQIVEFCEKHPDKLCQDGRATFFLFKENKNFFVADVYINSDGLRVDVNRFGYGFVWRGECRHRLVVPHLPVDRQD